MEKNNLNDEILIENFLKGDESSFKIIFERYYEKVNRIVYSYTKNYDDAKDVTQEIFLKVYESLKSFKKKSKFSTWIYRISVNMSISFLRKKSKEKNLFSIDEVGDIEERVEEDEPSYDRKLAEKILFELPENQRLAFILSQKEGKRYKEIAQILNVSEKAVESLIYRARENIKNFLEKNKIM
ncbi:MAG: RNA polymerase sigma factor [candidate division TA06 bacterium 32_111]|uniref:RNA polymerase sigma factor n=2 Tax=Bacteria candidate phyla TaxID=1783234 RepID=A0A124G0Q1_UNCT6|nr:MAG: RNA polymerase sigma factor [candidate division TA06 bacterium 32_111]KUK88210.1 MAG: RNA polymerase sigma factor [candidate division TA06 bacterium 34_109]HAF07143.1 RNA polymerase subunit sigma-70 [candidate division WOR-3 bacterium]HCP15994.1 RNA polymerase subunit sigma-70 [candidate division WOR-3 bacterium]